jgi:hypothetical protein
LQLINLENQCADSEAYENRKILEMEKSFNKDLEYYRAFYGKID